MCVMPGQTHPASQECVSERTFKRVIRLVARPPHARTEAVVHPVTPVPVSLHGPAAHQMQTLSHSLAPRVWGLPAV